MRNGHIGSNYTVLVAKIPQNQIRDQKSKEETLGFPNPVSELAYDVQIDFYDQVKLVNFYIFSPKIAKNAVFLKNHPSSFDHKNRSKRRMPILRPDLESLRFKLSQKIILRTIFLIFVPFATKTVLPLVTQADFINIREYSFSCKKAQK